MEYNGKEFKKRLALATGMTQSQIAEETGINHQTIVMWGHMVPSGQSLYRLHETLGVSIDYLLFGEDNEVGIFKRKVEKTNERLEKLEEALRREGLEI